MQLSLRFFTAVTNFMTIWYTASQLFLETFGKEFRCVSVEKTIIVDSAVHTKMKLLQYHNGDLKTQNLYECIFISNENCGEITIFLY